MSLNEFMIKHSKDAVYFVALVLAVQCSANWLAFGARAKETSNFSSMYRDPKPFLSALSRERRPVRPSVKVTGISVPHHLLAADLIARGFQAAADNHYQRVIVISPDHLNRSRRPLATTRRGINTVFGPIQTDTEATNRLLEVSDLFDDSDLFQKEHGVAAILPFVRHFFPGAKIVPIAVSYSATKENCDEALKLLKELLGSDTLVVQSTDYSHYLPLEIARQRDQETLNVIAANDADAVFHLNQPAHMDSRGSQYLQMKLQGSFIGSSGTVIANRNSSQYSSLGRATTSYIVTVYTSAPVSGRELRYRDQKVFFFAGDTYIGRYFTEPLARSDVSNLIVGKVLGVTAKAPLIVNLEGALLDSPPDGIDRDLHVMHAELAIPLLKLLNVSVSSLANNHSYDLGATGLIETRSRLAKSGIRTLGHGEIVDLGPFRLLGLNFIGSFEREGTPVIKNTDLEHVCSLKARPPLIAFVHWGREYTSVASDPEYSAAESLERCGVGAIIGAHSHQASSRIEALRGGEYQMTYSLGNHLFDQKSSRGSGALLEVRTFQQGTYAIKIIAIPNLFDLGVEQLRGQHENYSGNQLGK
jgi:AmmeMemoRadiSam system protein B